MCTGVMSHQIPREIYQIDEFGKFDDIFSELIKLGHLPYSILRAM